MEFVTKEEAGILLELLTRDSLLEREAAETLLHALVDIKESMNEIYDKVLPGLIQEHKSLTKEQVQEALWEIREQFRHVEYHVNDSKICD